MHIQYGKYDLFRSVKSLCSAQPITEDAEEANKKSRARSRRDSFHMWQSVSNTMTTDWPQDSCYATGERSSKFLFTQLVNKKSRSNFLLFILRSIIKCAITIQTTNNIESIRGATGHRGNKKLLFPDGRESENRSTIVPTSRLKFPQGLG